MTAIDLKQLAREHLEDARALGNTKRFSGAIYLAGYAVECALKFRICETLGWEEFPPNSEHRALKSHDLNFLLHYSGRLLEFKEKYLVPWQVVEKWNPEMRYETSLILNEDECWDYIMNVISIVQILI